MKAPGDDVAPYPEQIADDPDLEDVTDEYRAFADTLIQMAGVRLNGPSLPIDTLLVYRDDTIDSDEYEASYVVFLTVATSDAISGEVGTEFVVSKDDIESVEDYDEADADELGTFFTNYTNEVLGRIEDALVREVVAGSEPDPDEVADE